MFRRGIPITLFFAGAVTAQTPQQIEFFEKSVRPLLATHCVECHGANEKKIRGGLRLTTKADFIKGGDSGPSVVPGKPDESRLIKGLHYTDENLKMPPKGKLSAADIAVLTKWVTDGAAWPETAVPSGERPKPGQLFTDEQRKFWAFQPVADPPVPAVKNAEWVKNPIDAFILSQLEAKGLTPAKPADRRTLLRRVTYDLIGLPPTPEEIQDFVDDNSAHAWEHVIDRLMRTPPYGESQARHWLDIARYADSNGLDENTAFANAFRYRDYVIKSFNEDKPYDTFIKEQIAGDLLPDAGTNPDRLTGTGFLVLGPKLLAEPDKQKMKLDIADEQADTVGKAFLGLTLGCARCHDHKFDPIPTRDYYGLLGMFTSTRTMKNLATVAAAHERPLPVGDGKAMVLAVDEGAKYGDVKGDGKPRNLFVQIRGNYLTPGEEAPAVFPRILAGETQVSVGGPSAPDAPKPEANQTRYGQSRPHSGRLELALWLADPKNPLPARVMANRVWLHLFGEGIVRTPDNFGKLGDRPTHPELLDWLATQFVRNGWSVKKLQKTILMSNTYRMSSTHDAAAALADPDNKRLWRFNRRRLEAEKIRDGLLFAAGNIDLKMGGSLLNNGNFSYVTISPALDALRYNNTRRSVYLPVIRNSVFDFFQSFDMAEPHVPNGKRASTVIAPQALYMMNSPFVKQQANVLAAKLLKDFPAAAEARVRDAYLRAYGRPPMPEEIRQAQSFVSQYETALAPKTPDPAKRSQTAWAGLCQAIFAASEFMYLN